MTSEGLGEMFEGDSADMCAGKFPLMLMGGRANGQSCAVQTVSEDPHRHKRNFLLVSRMPFFLMDYEKENNNIHFLQLCHKEIVLNVIQMNYFKLRSEIGLKKF